MIRKFGTAPVFFTAISTILGAIMFLRFGFAVGNVGFLGILGIILIGHAVTIPTAMAIAEIATNQKVEGGGEYYIISRSFGLVIGGAIGIALYLSQAISVAFYIMAFTEAFTPLFNFLTNRFNLPQAIVWLLEQKQTLGIPALLGLTYIMLTKGANLGVKALYVVVITLALSLIAFFLGSTSYSTTHAFDPMATIQNSRELTNAGSLIEDAKDTINLTSPGSGTIANESIQNKQEGQLPNGLIPLGFFTIFAIIFPAFTGMTAGVGLSGDLKNPGKSIPLGTLSATIIGMIIYVLLAYKLTTSASPFDLANTDKMVMADIAWQGWWIIPVGLAAATISSALGSIMVAPRTLQAITRDKLLPAERFNRWLSKGKGENDEPYNASILTIVIAGAFIMAGALDGVARIISMFFMVTYGSLCLISFLNHFAANPSYRPRFKSRWYVSLFGAVACFGLMFFMHSLYAFLSILTMIFLYLIIAYYNKDKSSLSVIFQGVIFQFNRLTQVFLQKAEKEKSSHWRPSVIAFSSHTFERLSAFDLLRFISQKYGFGTYIHVIEGFLSRKTHEESKEIQNRLIKLAEDSKSRIYMETLVSPSYTSSIAQAIQLPGMAGTENNLLLFEFSKKDPAGLVHIADNFNLIISVDFDLMLLGSSEKGFGLKKQIHVWITSKDYHNANLMILLAFIIIGHREWKSPEIKIFAVISEEKTDEEKDRLALLIEQGRLPISRKNVSVIPRSPNRSMKDLINEKSVDADLTIIGFKIEHVKRMGGSVFQGYDRIGNVLFVHDSGEKVIA